MELSPLVEATNHLLAAEIRLAGEWTIPGWIFWSSRLKIWLYWVQSNTWYH